MSGDQETENKLSADTITEASLDLSHGITDDDKILWRKDKNAVDFSLNYAKLWCKFCKELVVALEKKASLEIELCRSWSKQFQSFESTVSSGTMFGAPMRSESLMMSKLIIDQCKEIETQNAKKLGKLLDVINRQRTEFSKTRKHYKEKWKSDCKKMMDAETTMLKTKAGYYQRCQQGVKLREELTTAQALLTYMQDHGIQETSTSYVATPTGVANLSSTNSTTVDGFGSNATLTSSSNVTQNDSISASQLSKQKLKVDKLEKQLADNDKKEIEQMYSYKESVETANNKLIEFEKKKMEHLCDIRLTTFRSDEIVKDTLAEYLKILAETRTTMFNEYASLSNKFQEYKPCHEYRCLIEKQMFNKPDVYSEKFQVELYHDCATSKEKTDSQITKGLTRFGIGTIKDIDHETSRGNRNILPSHSDSDSENEVTPTGDVPSSSNRTGVLNTIVEFGSNLFRQGGGGSSGNASNEVVRRGQPNKNKKSTSGSTSSMTGSAEGLGDKDMEWQKEIDVVMEIILKCIESIELNGLSTHGIYRISASKLKVGSVMDSLNNQGIYTDLINEQPITLANVVKSKLISLSEPLVPYNLYNEFVDLGKEAETGEILDLVNKLKALILQLPKSNKRLAGLVFHHLKKIANNSEENQMGSANLGTLFAPTLIKAKPRFRMADIKEYMDNKSQAKIVQIIIENVEALFGPQDQYYSNRSYKNDSPQIEELKIDDEKESIQLNISNLETLEENKVKQQRPHSSIIEKNYNISSFSESNFSRNVCGSLRIPISNQSSLSSQALDKPAPKMMDMLLGTDAVASIRSISPRSKKISGEISVDKQPNASDFSKNDKSPGLPHRSISVGSGPLPETIKLAQLSKPSSDSIFSKDKEESDSVAIVDKSVSSHYKSANRYNDLKRSALSSTESKNVSVTSESSQNQLLERNIKSSSSLLNRSRPASATTHSSYNYSTNTVSDLPITRRREQSENSVLQTDLSFHYIPEFASSSSFVMTGECSRLSENTPKYRYRSKSYATPTEPPCKSTNRYSSYSTSPFVRQSKARVPLSHRSLVDLLDRSKSIQDSSPRTFSSDQYNRRSDFLFKFCSVDNLSKFINSKIAKYQNWLIQPVCDEYYV